MEAAIRTMSLIELREQCRVWQLKRSGNKAHLQEVRFIQSLAQA
jgi:hypothetical protein